MFQLVAIAIEVMIVIVALMAAQAKRKQYMYGFALTFGLYVIFDVARVFSLPVSHLLLDLLFVVASLSALWAVWQIHKTK